MAGELEHAIVDWVANAPRSILFDDIYYSGIGPEESRHVFIDGNDLDVRFSSKRHLSIGELGFGAGLNLLVAWDLWRRTLKDEAAQLNFLSVEKFPLSSDDLRRAHLEWPQFSDLSAALLRRYPPLVRGIHQFRLDEGVTLTLCFGDAETALPSIEATIDAWFLDGFAPAKNPEMWTPSIFAEVARLSALDATAATFTVAGAVRRDLSASGFVVEKRPGFGRKREMLAARRTAHAPPSARSPWFQNGNVRQLTTGASVAIIGGGVAGASIAGELSASGLRPTIFDPRGLAAGTSGNPVGIIMPRLDAGDDAAARFFRSAYCHALATIEMLEERTGETFFQPCGALLVAADDEEKARQQKVLAANHLPQSWIKARGEGLFYPNAGVIEPVRYCSALASGAPLRAIRVTSLSLTGNGVLINLSDGSRDQFDAVVIANSHDAARFAQARTLPMTAVLGQIDFFPDATAPAFAIVDGLYAAPAPHGGLVVGATYEPLHGAAASRESAAATTANIKAARAILPQQLSQLEHGGSKPRASIRCQTPDRLPIIGPMPDWDFYGAEYDDLRLGLRREYPPGRVAPNIFIFAGLGSRGLVTAPLCAAALRAEMIGAPSPLEREIAEALHPARFFIRDLKRSKRILPA